MTVSSMPTGENIPDLQADNQFLYGYYGYPSFSYPTSMLATYHVPVGKFWKPNGTIDYDNILR